MLLQKDISKKEKKIIEAATNLFGEKGYSSTSVEEICEEVGISKGGLFHYFDSKEDILFTIHDVFINYELNKAKEIIQREEPPDDILKDLIICQLESIGKYQSFVSVFYQEKRFFSQDRFGEIKRKRKQYENIFLQIIDKGVEQGIFREEVPPNLIVKAVLGICNWTYLWMNPEGKFSPRELGKFLFKIVNEGISK